MFVDIPSTVYMLSYTSQLEMLGMLIFQPQEDMLVSEMSCIVVLYFIFVLFLVFVVLDYYYIIVILFAIIIYSCKLVKICEEICVCVCVVNMY